MLELILYIIYALLTLLSVYIAWKLMFAFKHFKMKRLISEPIMLKDVPSVSVCIPARNETHAMTQCLERVVASTYPKLEIIVLDDSSADNTSVLIKSFAHAGVRFVEGSHLPEGWLGKNHALQGLLEEASGSYILYMDVDTHIEPETIGQLVAYALQERASMVSVLPRRTNVWRTSVLFGTLRFYLELILHRRGSPAVASSAWLISRTGLIHDVGGITPLRATVQPESRLAAFYSLTSRYRFIISTPLLGLSYEKKWKSQVDTSIRLLYPIIGGKVIYAIVAGMIMLLAVQPIVSIVQGLFVGWTIIQIMAAWQIAVYMALYGAYLTRVWDTAWWVGALLWPVVLIQEFIVLLVSFNRYATGAVMWKGRSVMLRPKPVLKVTSSPREV